MLALKPVEFVVGRLPDTDKARAIMKYPLGHVRDRVLKEGAVSEEIIDVAIAEYRKFMILFALGFGKLAMCSREVDEVWHTHILFTQDYINFCNQLIGKYVHHMPDTSETPVGADSVERFLGAYEQVHGSVPSIWNSQNTLCGHDCDGRPMCCATCSGDDDDD